MGYYTNPPTNKPPKKSRGWLVPIIIGIVVGIILMLVIYPTISKKSDFFGNDENTGLLNKEDEDNDKSTNMPKKEVQVDVTTQITEVVDQVSDAVVGITNIQKRNDFWTQNEADEAGTGSGVIYKKNKDYAYIVTNHHVVEQADVLEVVLSDDTHFEAELLGSDLFTDLAVLRVDAQEVDSTMKMGASKDLKVGEPVIAIGNPLGHMFAGSVTQGIISGKQRTIPQDFNQDGRPDWQAEVIQTDAAINPGNSGGALINIDGQLIGINSMKISQTIAQGIGFAIPIDNARPIIDDLEENGIVKRPFLGVEIYSLEEVPKTEWNETLQLPNTVEGGVYIWSIEPLSPASEAGLDKLDVITEFDGKPIHDILDLRQILYQEKDIGDEIKIVFFRDGKKMETTVRLGEQK